MHLISGILTVDMTFFKEREGKSNASERETEQLAFFASEFIRTFFARIGLFT